MTLSVSTQAAPIGTKLVVNDDADSTPETDVTGAAGALYGVEVDNSANPGAAVYLKIWDNAAPDPLTDAPDWVVQVKAGLERSFVIPQGWAFTNLSFSASTSAALGVAGASDPASAVTVRLVTN